MNDPRIRACSFSYASADFTFIFSALDRPHYLSSNFLLSFNGFWYSFLTSSMQMLEIVLIKHVAAVLGEMHCRSLSINGLYSTIFYVLALFDIKYKLS